MSNPNPEPSHCSCGKHHAGEISHVQMVAEIRANPPRLASLLDGLSDANLARPRPDGGWSIKQIVDHLCGSVLDYLRELRQMLDEDSPVIGDVVAPEYEHENLAAMLMLYAANETKLADMFAALSDEQWQRTAIIGWPGGSGYLVVDDYAVHAVDHDREHLAEIRKLRGEL